MSRYARRPKRGESRRGWLRAGLARAGGAAARNPVAVGGTTAFFVSFAFVAANALWYQPQVHPSAFVSTRGPVVEPAPEVVPEPAPRRDARVVTEPQEEATPPRDPEPRTTGSVPETTGGDPTVRAAQRVLQELGLYRGDIDGLKGPQTREAVENYRRIVGLEPGTALDGPLLHQLGLAGEGSADAAAPPTPQPAPREAGRQDGGVRTASVDDGGGEEVRTASVGNGGREPVVRRVQAALRDFGHDGIAVDGVMGGDTRAAIREFQSLFGLQVTGEADSELLAKMREIGLID